MPEIREDEWLAELARLERTNADGSTAQEIADAIGCSVEKIRKVIGALIAAGRVRLNGVRRVPRIDGRMNSIPVYEMTGRKMSATAKCRARK